MAVTRYRSLSPHGERARARGPFRHSLGVTITEMMLVLSIVSIITVLGNILFVNIVRFFRLNQARIEVQRDARTVFNLMGRNLRQAYSTSLVVDQASGQPPYSRITFQKVTGENIVYYQDGKTLYQVEGGTRALTGNLRYIAFSHPRTDDESIVSISITLEKATYQGGSKALQLSVEKIRIMN